ncbi:MAG TPA: LacI family DNA-binding transcriptional regulator [Actinopolymorphaceae bacterium]|nr:LacI family DNA-binding transcriptional regulator [Actinopolymorphaceae bacterium]
MSQQPGRRATLRQVAERAGVSVGTASAVFSGNATVSSVARKVVHDAAATLGYQPRRTPGHSRRPARDAASIGLVIRVMEHSLPTNPFYSSVLQGAQRECARLGVGLSYEVVAGLAPHDPLPLVVRRGQVDGLLLVGYLPRHTVDEIAATGVPCVLVDNGVDEDPGSPVARFDSVRNDDEQGGYVATRHLLDLGHTDPVPAMISGPMDFPSIRDRVRGYRRAILEAGRQVDGALVRSTTLSPAGGRAEMDDLLARPAPPTAVFCCNDATALGALAALRERGVTVPDDFSVVGYDDIESAGQAAPPLTTVRVDKELMGAQGVWHLVQRIRQPAMAGRATTLQVTLLPRGSSARRGTPRPEPQGSSRHGRISTDMAPRIDGRNPHPA